MREGQQPVDQAREAIDLGDGALQLVADRRAGVVLEVLDPQAQGGQRTANWCEASATNCSWVPTTRSRRDDHVVERARELAHLDRARGVVGPHGQVARLGAASRVAQPGQGRLTQSASHRPATATAASTTSATPARISQ